MPLDSDPPALDVRVVSETAAVPAAVAYDLARRIALLPKWASGLASGVFQDGDAWFADSPMGRVRIRMAPENTFGVLDHDVTLPDGQTVRNSFRVVAIDDHHCVMTFVVVRQAGATQEAFEADVAHVQKDLRALRGLLEDDSLRSDTGKSWGH